MRAITTAGLLALVTATAACAPQERGLESVHQPVVTRSAYVLDVNLDGSGGIGAGERARLTTWLDALRLGYGDRIALDFGTGGGSEAARDALAGIAARYGMLVSNTAPVTAGDVVPGSARVVVSRSTAEVPGCPDWSKKLEADYTGGNHSNFGCGINSTMTAMIADKEDLVSGRAGDGSGDARQAGKPVDAYRSKSATTGN